MASQGKRTGSRRIVTGPHFREATNAFVDVAEAVTAWSAAPVDGYWTGIRGYWIEAQNAAGAVLAISNAATGAVASTVATGVSTSTAGDSWGVTFTTPIKVTAGDKLVFASGGETTATGQLVCQPLIAQENG